MIVKNSAGADVSFITENGKSLFDSSGVEWYRDASKDDLIEKRIGYTCSTNPAIYVQLTMAEMVRVCKGPYAMNTPTTVGEMRCYASRMVKSLTSIVDQWSDQRIREILIEAEDGRKHPGLLLERYAQAQWEEEHPVVMPTGGTGGVTGAHEATRTPKNTTRPRKQEGSLSVAHEGVSVLLTPKQLEFMERLSECPGWEKYGVKGEYMASEYAAELADSMNSMSVGAVVTTLREKHLITAEKRRIGAIKCCVFKLTDLGIGIYNTLAGNRTSNT